jgi:hypothetical protein
LSVDRKACEVGNEPIPSYIEAIEHLCSIR